MTEDNKLTVVKAMKVIGKASKEIQDEFPGTTENQLVYAEALLTEAVSCFMADILEPVESDAIAVKNVVEATKDLLNQIKEGLVKKKRKSVNWSN